MSDVLTRFDCWLTDDGPAALVATEHLMPVEGAEGVFFPPTFAASEDKTFRGGYNIDAFSKGGNVCLVDSVGSQANRIEPIFTRPPYQGLVPQVVIVAGNRRINLLHAGHRAGDAVARCSSLGDELRQAFCAVLRGDAEPLARIAPTSIVFGAWDSRDTQAKLPRLFASTIRAFDVEPLTRSAQYIPAVDYVEAGLLEEPGDKQARDAYATRGFVHVPASATHGGVIARGGIRRETTIHLAALRTITGPTAERSVALRRYILGLCLVAFGHGSATYLRQGCNLVLNPDRPSSFLAVFGNGRRELVDLVAAQLLEYARLAARDFGIDPDRPLDAAGGSDREAPFDPERARQDLAGDETTPKKSKGRARKSR